MIYRAILTHKAVRKYLQREVDDLTAKIFGIKEGLQQGPAAGSSKNLQESMPNANELKEILEDGDQVQLVGGRAASAEEFLRQMQVWLCTHDCHCSLGVPHRLTTRRTPTNRTLRGGTRPHSPP